MSAGFLGSFFGIGASISGEHDTSSGKKTGEHEGSDTVSYTFSAQSMGPATTNPGAFYKFLANSSSWAIIDRGSENAYIPMWELVQDLGKDFEKAAKILKNTWEIDKEKWHKQQTSKVSCMIL